MDGVSNAIRQQQSQANTNNTKVAQQKQEAVKVDVVKEIQKEVSEPTQKFTSKEQVQELVNQLNDALAPMSTSVKFGFDNTSDVFYVSVLESETSRILRRFPAEQAASFLPKMQEVTGILFDSKG